MVKPTLVFINGMGGCGKSTFIQLCKEYCIKERNDWWVHEFSTVDRVKQVATFAGWNGGKTAEDRVFLSDLKKALAKWDNSPVNYVFTEIDETLDKVPAHEVKTRKHIFFVNSREPLDIEAMSKIAQEREYNILTIEIKRDDMVINEVPELIDQINNTDYDMVISNNGNLNYLYTSAGNFIENIILNS